MKKSVDARRTFWIYAVAIVGVALIVGIALPVINLLPVNGFVIFAVFAVLFVVIGYVASRAIRAISNRFAAEYSVAREAARVPAIAAGWTYADEAPAPSREVAEAVFRSSSWALVAARMTNVIAGVYRGRDFTAGYIDGYEVITNGPDAAPAGARGENIIQLALPGLLPELRLRDRSVPKSGDYGMTLPGFATGDPALDARWEVQTYYPDFARELLTEPMRAFLRSVPSVPFTINIRVGELISSRDPEGSFDSISQRLGLLSDFADLIPEISWNRATPVVAGSGAHNLISAGPTNPIWNPTRS